MPSDVRDEIISLQTTKFGKPHFLLFQISLRSNFLEVLTLCQSKLGYSIVQSLIIK